MSMVTSASQYNLNYKKAGSDELAMQSAAPFVSKGSLPQ